MTSLIGSIKTKLSGDMTLMKKLQILAAVKPLLTTLAVIVVISLAPLASSQEQAIFSFGASGYVAPANGGVAIDPKGNLYLAANGYCSGGGYCGALWELSPPKSSNGAWYSSSLDGISGYINAGLTFANGNLYGTATGGTLGYGYVFQFSHGNLSTIYNFQGGSDAGTPASALIADAAGNLFGASYNGQIFELKPPSTRGGAWTESVLYNAGNSPTGVILDAHGNLFGMTLLGGTSGNGFIFELSPPTSGSSWTEQTLYNFPAYTTKAIRRPAAPQGSGVPPKGLDLGTENTLAMDSHGNLFGTQTYGGASGVGYVFELTPPSTGGSWSFSNLYSFTGAATGSTDGAYPGAGVTVGGDGSLYGTTYLGGNAAGTIDGSLGTIFKLTPPSIAGGNWTETILRRFTAGFDGANPAASLLLGPKGVLYGVTNFGGGNQLGGNNYMPGSGTVFQIHP